MNCTYDKKKNQDGFISVLKCSRKQVKKNTPWGEFRAKLSHFLLHKYRYKLNIRGGDQTIVSQAFKYYNNSRITLEGLLNNHIRVKKKKLMFIV